MNNLNDTAYHGSHHIMLLNSPINLDMTIMNDYKTSIDFTWCGHVYAFKISRWSSRGQAAFLKLFHSHTLRNISDFGSVIEKDDGTIDIQMGFDNKKNAIKQASLDIMKCLNNILDIHQRSILDYAVWYSEKNSSPINYSQYITLITCHCIVHNDFMSPLITWELIEFY